MHARTHAHEHKAAKITMRVPAEPWGARRLWTTEVGERAGMKRDARRIDTLLRCAVEGRMSADVENAAAALATHDVCVREFHKEQNGDFH